MKKLLILFLLITSCYSKSYNYWQNSFNSLSLLEKQNLRDAYLKASHLNLGWSMSAIMFKESFGGRYSFNINNAYSIDVGYYMVNTKEALRREGKKLTKWNVARMMEKLQDKDYNFIMAVRILQDCVKKADGDWRTSWRLYNGWLSGSKRSYDYSRDIAIIVKVLQRNLFKY